MTSNPWDNAAVVNSDNTVTGDGHARTVRMEAPPQRQVSAAPPAVPPAPTPAPVETPPVAAPAQSAPPQPAAQPPQVEQQPPVQQPPAQQEQVHSSFEQEFQQRFGVPVEQAATQFQQLQETVAAQQAEQGRQALQDHWGVHEAEATRRYNLVIESFQKLQTEKPELAKQLDDIDGAKWIWDNVVPGSVRAQEIPEPAPTLDRGHSIIPTAAPQYDLTKEEFKKMDRAATAQNWQRILNAYTTGRVQR